MTPIVFADLDDTLFQTARKMAAPPDADRRAARALNGRHSYMTAAQAHLVDWLVATTRLVPVTARSSEALGRVSLPFADHRICANGAVILGPDGTPDPAWQARTAAVARARRGTLGALADAMAARDREGAFRWWIVEEAGHGIYFCVKSNGAAARLDAVDGPLAAVAGADMVRHRNDNNLAFIPPELTKAHAVAHLLARLNPDGEAPVLGMGDSLTDLPFLRLCDLMALPARSQAAALLPGGEGEGA